MTETTTAAAAVPPVRRSWSGRALALGGLALREAGARLGGLRDRGTVRRADRRLWASATSLAEVGEVMGLWLTGAIASRPGYYGVVDVDEDDAPGLTRALTALCWAGAVTDGSQAGHDGPDSDGVTWTQLAWVDAFMTPDLADRLRRAAEGTSYRVVSHTRGGEMLTVTWVDGEPVTGAGWRSPRGPSMTYYRAAVGTRAWGDLRRAAQISIVDTVPGRNTLWAWLTDLLAEEVG